MKVLALDFDGVIADSQMECLFVGFNSYLKFHRDTKLFNGQEITFDKFDELKEKYKETIEKYKKLRPYVIDAFSFYVILHIIENNIAINDQNQFNNVTIKLMKGFYGNYVKNFYDVRFSLQDKNFEMWLKIEVPFEKIIKGIKELEKKYIITIATNNRERTVVRFLKKYNIKPRVIADSNMGVDKKMQLEHIKNKLRVNFEDISFVDDQVKHFPKLLKLGVKCYLATWGYNNEEQREETKKIGVVLLTEGNFYKELAL